MSAPHDGAVGDARKRYVVTQAPASQPIPAPVDSGAIGRLNDEQAEELEVLIVDSGFPSRGPEAWHVASRIAAAVADWHTTLLREHTDRALDRCLRVVNELSDLLDQIAERIDEVGRVDRVDFLDLFIENDLRDLLPSIAENWEIVRAARQEQGHA